MPIIEQVFNTSMVNFLTVMVFAAMDYIGRSTRNSILKSPLVVLENKDRYFYKHVLCNKRYYFILWCLLGVWCLVFNLAMSALEMLVK